MLDTRQFRTDQPAEDNFGSTDPDSVLAEPFVGETLFDDAGILDPNATMLGAQQERWLTGNLERSGATWNVLAQQVMLGQWNLTEAVRFGTLAQLPPGTPPEQREAIDNILRRIDDIFNVDAWDGYMAARRRLFDVLARVRPNNPVVLSGDIHSAWGINLLDDVTDPNADILAAEFVCTAISAIFDALDPRPADAVVRASVLADNPQVEFFNGLFRGYCLCDVDQTRWRTTYRAAGTLADIVNPDPLALVPFEDTPVETDAVLEIEAGFNAPGSGARIETEFARIPLGV